MATVTYTASMFSRRYTLSSNLSTTEGIQGATTLGQCVGVINFTTMNLLNKIITGITLITTCTSSAGYGNSSTKTLYFKKCTSANPTTSTSGTGSSFVGDALGTISGTNFYNASNVRRTVTSGSALFNALKAHLETGAHSLAIYAPDAVPESGYTTNYLYLDGLQIEIVYEEGTVYYNDGGVWKKCLVYWADAGVWKQCVPYFPDSGVWKQGGG